MTTGQPPDHHKCAQCGLEITWDAFDGEWVHVGYDYRCLDPWESTATHPEGCPCGNGYDWCPPYTADEFGPFPDVPTTATPF